MCGCNSFEPHARKSCCHCASVRRPIAGTMFSPTLKLASATKRVALGIISFGLSGPGQERRDLARGGSSSLAIDVAYGHRQCLNSYIRS